jgi:hypothetical protein
MFERRRLSGASYGSGDVSCGVIDENHRPKMAHRFNAPDRVSFSGTRM